MVEALADVGGERRLGHHLRPVEQQVVVIEDVLALLGFDIGGKQVAELRLPARAPGEGRQQDLFERQLGIHRPRIDLQAGALGGKAAFGLGEAELVAHEVHQIGRVLPVMDGKARAEPDLFGIFAEKPGADGVERARPGQRRAGDRGAEPRHASGDILHAARHFGRRAAGEGQEQDAAGIGAGKNEVRDAMRQRVGLAGAGAGDDEERAGFFGTASARSMDDSRTLLRIEFLQPGSFHAGESEPIEQFTPRTTFPRLFATGALRASRLRSGEDISIRTRYALFTCDKCGGAGLREFDGGQKIWNTREANRRAGLSVRRGR